MSEPDSPATAGHFPDDGIPVLTEVVDPALLPEIDPSSLEPEDEDNALGPPSLAMFPELEADAGYPLTPEAPPPHVVANIIETSPAMPLAALTAPQAPDPAPAARSDMPGDLSAALPELPLEASNAAHYEAPSEGAPETLDVPAVDSHSMPQALQEPSSQFAPQYEAPCAGRHEAPSESAPETLDEPAVDSHKMPQALREPPSQIPSQRESSYAERYAARYAALHQLPPMVLVTPSVEHAHTASEPADQVTQTVPAEGEIVAPELPSELETRIFESIAARVDRLLEQRLEAIVPGVVEAALYGIQADMAASVKQALREAVEQAVRNEFERKREP